MIRGPIISDWSSSILSTIGSIIPVQKSSVIETLKNSSKVTAVPSQMYLVISSLTVGSLMLTFAAQKQNLSTKQNDNKPPNQGETVK